MPSVASPVRICSDFCSGTTDNGHLGTSVGLERPEVCTHESRRSRMTSADSADTAGWNQAHRAFEIVERSLTCDPYLFRFNKWFRVYGRRHCLPVEACPLEGRASKRFADRTLVFHLDYLVGNGRCRRSVLAMLETKSSSWLAISKF